MAFTQGQLDALDEAIATGTLRVTYHDKTVEYRSLSEMMQIRQRIADALAASAGTTTSRSSVAAFRKG